MDPNRDVEKVGEKHEELSQPLIGQKTEGKELQLWFVLLSTFVAVCGSFSFGNCVGYSSPVQYALMDELQLSYSQYSVFGSILNIGAMLGAITCGRTADILGRKGAMKLSAIICIIGWIGIYHASEPVLLDFARFLTGYAAGTISYVVPMFIGEISPVSIRGGLAASNQFTNYLLICFAALYCYRLVRLLCSRCICNMEDTCYNWYNQIFLADALIARVIPCVVLLVGLFFIPESPRWLAMVGQEEESEAALRKLRGPDADISHEMAQIREYLETLGTLPKVSIINMFDKSNIRPVIVAVGLMAFQQFVGINGIVFYANKIFVSAGFNPNIGSITYSCLQVVVTAFGASIIDSAGRRPVLLASASGMLVGSLIIATSFLFKTHQLATDLVPIAAVIGVMVYIGSFSVGMGAGPWLIMSEVFPLHVKGMGGGMVTLMNWFGAWAVSFSFNFLMLWSSYGTFYIDAFVCALAILFIYNWWSLEQKAISFLPCEMTLLYMGSCVGGILCRTIVFQNQSSTTTYMENKEVRKALLEGDEETANGNGVDDGNEISSVTLSLVFSTLVAISGSFGFGTALGYSSPAESGIMNDLGLSTAEYSVFSSILTIGGILGAALSGRIADFFGRKGAMWFSEIFCLMGWLAILFSEDAVWLDIGRLVLGYGIGLLSYVVPVYIVEISPKNRRGEFTGLSQLMVGCGQSLFFFIGLFVNWRTLALIGTLPCMAQLLGLFFIPESPRWLAKIGREEYKAVLQRFRGENTDISQEAAEIKDYTETLQRLSKAAFIDLFQRKYAYSVIVGVGLMVFQQFGGLNGFAFYATEILELADFNNEIGKMAVAVVQIPTFILGVLLMDRSGRRPLLMASAAGTCLGCLLTGLAFLFQDLQQWEEVTPILAFSGVMVYLASFALGMAGIPWIITSEIYPITIKGSAGSLVTLVSWFGSWLIAYTFNFLYGWSSAGTFFVYSSICGCAVLFIAKLVPETKGRTLEEIQESITHTFSLRGI
ncbi:uncharacterized protein LOC132296032 [Cornus florida]|uniref:uncharacterized protein LOC132296032 n=1 Tax=Cornus florida TaxID=4283 RepID=UPI0028A24740|nr:uncharacterized protein LOC132296032 [Cornus florida]